MTTTDRLPRKLAAVLYADVAGYSRLTAEDEDATHRRLREYLDLVAANVKRHGGRVVHYAGDAVLAKFDATVDALACATDVQHEIAVRNSSLPDDRRVAFRIGVNLGDVIEDRGDIYGDGVNVAARLAALAAPGESCVSESVRVAVGKRLALDFEDLGEQQLKNIDHPVRAHRVRVRAQSIDDAATAAATSRAGTEWFRSGGFYASVGLSALVLVIAVLAFRPFEGSEESAASTTQGAAADRTTSPAPSIKPLTFDGGLKEFPQLSPNGEMVAFHWDGRDRDNVDIYVQGIGPATRPIRITEQLGLDIAPVWSPDGRELAYLELSTNGWSIAVIPFPGGQSKKLVQLQPPLFDRNNRFIAALSWHGDFLVYGEKPSPNAPARIVRLNRRTLEKQELTAPPAGDLIGDYAPAYSPDGSKIAFIRGPAVNANLDIWAMDADGSNQRRITASQLLNAGSVAWSPDAEEIFFSAGDLIVQRAYSVRLDEGTPYPLRGLGANDRSVTVVRDRLAFAQYQGREINLMRAPGRLAADRDVPASDLTLDGSALVFSPRGDRIAWQSRAVGVPQVWVADWDADWNITNPRPVTNQRTGAFFPQWSSDGLHVAFESYDGTNADVYVVNVETEQAVPVTSDSANERQPVFSRDGQWIYFSTDRGGVRELLKVPSQGGAAQPAVDGVSLVAPMEETIGWPVESSDRRFFYYQRDADVWRIPVDGSAEPEHILAKISSERGWAIAPSGIYYFDDSADRAVRYLDLVSREITDIRRGNPGTVVLSVSPDEQSVVFSQHIAAESDLWLVENFR